MHVSTYLEHNPARIPHKPAEEDRDRDGDKPGADKVVTLVENGEGDPQREQVARDKQEAAMRMGCDGHAAVGRARQEGA